MTTALPPSVYGAGDPQRCGTLAPMTLHDAIDMVLSTRATGMTPRELAAEINRRGLYIRPSDGQPVPSRQINARVANKTYRDRYRKDHLGRISMA
jgi:hypothetical protein